MTDEKVSDLEFFDPRAWNEGSPGAFKAFFIHQYPVFYSFAHSLLENDRSARNIVTEAMFLLWKKRADFDSLVNCKAFLYNAVRLHCLQFLQYLQQEPCTDTYVADKRGWPALPPDALVAVLAFAEGYDLPPQVASDK